MDRLGPLNAFIQAAEKRSFTAAGRELGISSSAIGKAIARLEERLGAQLFHRTTRSVTLTPEGSRFLARCQTIFKEIEAAELELAAASAVPRGRLRVSLPAIGMLMMPAIASFAEAYPDIQLDLDFSDRLVDVIEEGFDAVLRTGKVLDSRLMMRRIGSYTFVIVATPAYLERNGTPQIPEDLRQQSCLFHRWPGTGKLERWILERDGEEVDLEVPVSTVASTMEPLIALAERGLGLLYTPTFTVRRQIADGTLVSVLAPYLRASSSLQILWPPGKHASPNVKVFVDHMVRSVLANV